MVQGGISQTINQVKAHHRRSSSFLRYLSVCNHNLSIHTNDKMPSSPSTAISAPSGSDDPKRFRYIDKPFLYSHFQPDLDPRKNRSVLIVGASLTCYRGETLKLGSETNPLVTIDHRSVGTDRFDVPAAEMKRIYDLTYTGLDAQTRYGVDHNVERAFEDFSKAVAQRAEAYANNPPSVPDNSAPPPSNIDFDGQTRTVPLGAAGDLIPIWTLPDHSFKSAIDFKRNDDGSLRRVLMTVGCSAYAASKSMSGDEKHYAMTVNPAWIKDVTEKDLIRLGWFCNLSPVENEEYSTPEAETIIKSNLTKLTSVLLERRIRLHNPAGFRLQRPSEPESGKHPTAISTWRFGSGSEAPDFKVSAVPMSNVDCVPEDCEVQYMTKPIEPSASSSK